MKFLVAVARTAFALFSSLAPAAEVPFNQAQFDAARAAGQPGNPESISRRNAVAGTPRSGGIFYIAGL